MRGHKTVRTEGYLSALRTDVRSGTLALAVVLFGVIAGLIAFDIVADYRAGTEPSHLLTEAGVMVIALAGVGVLWRQLSVAERRAQRLSVDLEAARRETEQFRAEAGDALRGLGDAIDHQFTRWNLTPAEREVGLL